MLAAIRSARRKPSHFALALALAGGAVIGATAFAPAAAAQEYSDEFVAVYQPVANLTTGETPNFEAARAQIETVIAAVQSADDRNAAGNLVLILGNHFDDDGLKRRGLEMMVASGLVPADRIGQFHFYIGSLAYNAQDYAASRAALEAALAAGYADNDADPANDPEYIILQSHFAEEAGPQAVQYVLAQADARAAAGGQIPERFLLLALQESYDLGLVPQAAQVSTYLLRNYPSQQNWVNALQVMGALSDLPPATRVDLLRLMRETDALTQRAEYVRLIEDLDPRVMGTEVLAVLAEGAASGVLPSSDPYVVEVSGISTPRAAADRSEMASIAADGERGDGREAMLAGNVLYSLGEYAQAEHFFQLALDRGHERDAALVRLGIAQVKQGNYAAAQESFDGVSGERAPIAQMWSLYAQSLAS